MDQYLELKKECENLFPEQSAAFLDYYEIRWLFVPETFIINKENCRRKNIFEVYQQIINPMLKKHARTTKFFG